MAEKANAEKTKAEKKADKTAEKASDIGFVGMLRWAWRQLITMKVALILLLVLALAAIPGSLLPQRIQDPGKVTAYIADNPGLGEVLDTLQMFDVYSSVWFTSVYILLMVSLVGCIWPRTIQHWKAMRADPPKAPRRLNRMPAHTTLPLQEGETAAEFLVRAREVLKKAGYKTQAHPDHIAAERGYLRETGNLLFHVAILALTITFAVGALVSYSGQRIIVEGETFSNSLVSYDSFTPGAYYNPDRLEPFRLTLNRFDATFDSQSRGAQFGSPRHFAADITSSYQGTEEHHVLGVNQPIRVGGASVFLVGNGYAPVITTKNAAGETTFSGPVVFLPEDGLYTSRGVVKVPDTGGEQLGFGAVFLPTAAANENNDLVSAFPALEQPYLAMSVFKGDLGLDSGVPQNVYSLDTNNMTQVTDASGQPLTVYLAPGQTATLPDGLGTVSFDGVNRFIAVDVHSNPTGGLLATFSVLLLAGLALSLFIPRRRMWVRVTGDTIEIAALARGEDPRVERAVEALAVELGDSENSLGEGD